MFLFFLSSVFLFPLSCVQLSLLTDSAPQTPFSVFTLSAGGGVGAAVPGGTGTAQGRHRDGTVSHGRVGGAAGAAERGQGGDTCPWGLSQPSHSDCFKLAPAVTCQDQNSTPLATSHICLSVVVVSLPAETAKPNAKGKSGDVLGDLLLPPAQPRDLVL